MDLRSTGRTNPAWVRKLAPWTAGEPYDPEHVAELERRLLDTSVYDSVTVSLAPPGGEAQRPVIVALSDREPRTIEAGASYSTTEGGGVDVRWTHYNRMRRADTISVFGRLSSIDSRAGVELALPHWRRAQQTLRTGASGYRVRTDAYDETGAGVRADVTRRYGRTSYVTVGGSLDASRTTELKAGTLTTLGRDLITAAALGDLALDRSDDPLNPKRGWKLSARGEPTLIVGDENLPYLRLQTQGSTYFAFGPERQTVLAGRLRVGRILNATVDQLPASDRFFAGGGGSVRGFGYQEVGPRLADGTPKGGLSLIEASAEVRHDLSRRWGLAVFVDAGAVGSSGPLDLGDLAVGAGAGVRYNLGFAPIRFDVAMPVARRRGEAPFQFYVSIGQSF
jgi:translocation and assembly module TamA